MIITSNEIEKIISIPTSKSYANRALILATLKKEKIILKNLPKAQDVKDMLDVLWKLGICENIDFKYLEINKTFPQDEIKENNMKELYLGEGGTTIRFLLPLLALGSQKYLLKVNPRFKLRPFHVLLSILKKAGAEIELSDRIDELCTLKGPIHLSEIEIDCSQTTQNLSAFLLLQSTFDFNIKIKNLISSRSYIEMSKSMVNIFLRTTEYSIPVDMSSASYFIALGCIYKNIKIKNIFCVDSLQADSEIFNVLDKLGAKYTFSSSGLTISKSEEPMAFDVDISTCLDLAPTLAFLASFCKGKSELKNMTNLKFKESNRIDAITNVLDSFGVIYEYLEDRLFIHGAKTFKEPKVLNVVDDHRIVMMASLFLKVLGGGEIHPASAVKKSFPEFFELLS